MKTITQQLNIKTFPFTIEVDGNCVYFEDSRGYWWKQEYQDNKRVYFEDSYDFWYKCEYQNDNIVYFEDSDGHIEDDRPKIKAQAKVAEARKLLEEAEKELNDL